MLNRETFDELTQTLSESHNWKISEDSLTAIYEQVAHLVDDLAFADIFAELLGREHVKPAMLVKACREERKIQQQASPPPALPPTSAMAKPCPEYVKFKRLGREIVSRGLSFRYASRPPHSVPTRLSQSSTCKHSTNGEPLCNRSQTCKCLQEWDNRPLTDEDWQLAANTDPAKAIANALGFRTVEGGGNYAT